MHAVTRRQFGAIALSAAACAFGGLAGCTPAATKTTQQGSGSAAAAPAPAPEGTIVVGVRSDIVGFGLQNEKTGKYYGLEIDIAEEMASRMGYKEVEYTTVTPDNRKETLLAGEVDALVACYSIADSRLENLDFSPAYYTDNVIAVVQKSSLIDSISDLKGCTFGTMAGSNAAPLLSIKLYNVGFTNGEVVKANDDNSEVDFDTWHLSQFPSYQALSNALEEGIVDAIVLDGAIAHTYINDDRSIIQGFNVAEQSYGVATQKNSELSGMVHDAIQGMLDDGTIAKLVDKWD